MVAKAHDAVVEPVFVEEVEVGADIGWEGWFAAAEQYGPCEQVAFVDETCCESLSSQVRPTNGEVAGRCGLQFLDGSFVEVASRRVVVVDTSVSVVE